MVVYILADVLVVQHVLYLLHVLWVEINTGAKTTLKFDDFKKFVRRNDALTKKKKKKERRVCQCNNFMRLGFILTHLKLDALFVRRLFVCQLKLKVNTAYFIELIVVLAGDAVA